MSQGISSLLWFIAIIAAIPAVLWLLKRSPVMAGQAHGVMRSVASLPIGQHQRLVTVEVGTGEDRKWLVLGVTAQGITTLHTMAPQAEAPAAPAAGFGPGGPVTFQQLLSKLQRKEDGGAR